MRLHLLIFIAIVAVCTEAQQRQLRRFSPSRSRLAAVKNEPEVEMVEMVEPEIEVAAVVPTRSRQRNVLRPRPFSARFSGRTAHKDVTEKTVQKSTAEASTTKPPAKNQRRRPHIHRRPKINVKPTIKDMPNETVKDEMIKTEMPTEDMDEPMKKESIAKKDLPKKATIVEEIKKSEKSKPLSIPKIKHRPLPLRIPRIRSRSRSIPKKEEPIAKAAQSKVEEPLEQKVETDTAVETSPKTGANHRFSGRSGLIGRRSRIPRIKTVSQKSDVSSDIITPELSPTVEDFGEKAPMSKQDVPVIQIEDKRNISLLNSESTFDKLIGDVETKPEETRSETHDPPIVDCFIQQGDTTASLETPSNDTPLETPLNYIPLKTPTHNLSPLLEADTEATKVNITTVEPILIDNTKQDKVENIKHQLILNITLEHSLDITTEQGNQVTTEQTIQIATEHPIQIATEQPSQITTEQGSQVTTEPPIQITTEEPSVDIITIDKHFIKTQTNLDITDVGADKMIEHTLLETTTPQHFDCNIGNQPLVSHAESDILEKVDHLEITTKRVQLEIPLEHTIKGIHIDTPSKILTTVSFLEVNNNEYDYGDLIDYNTYIDYPEYYSDAEQDTVVKIAVLEQVTTVQPTAATILRNEQSFRAPQTKHFRQKTGPIGTIEDTPEDQIREILSGLGSRRRGLSRI